MRNGVVLSSLAFILLVHAFSGFADERRNPGLISATAVSAIAKETLAEEAERLNSSLLNPDTVDFGYSRDLLKDFVQQTFKNQIDVEELYAKCVYSKADLINLNDPVLRPQDDITAARMKSLETMGALYGKEVWRLFSQACNFAQERFDRRLTELTSNGTPIRLSASEIKTLSSILFFPTLVGNAPSLGQEIISNLFKTAISGSMIFGPISALSGMAIGGSVILVATATNSSYGMLNEITSIFQKSPNQKLADLLAQSPVDVNLDLTPSEENWERTLN